MWMVKGILLGVVIFIVGGISLTVIRLRITMYRLEHAARSANIGTSYYYQSAISIRGLIHDPIIWAAFLISVAIGIWIVRARMRHP